MTWPGPKRNWLGPETESTTVRHTRVCQKRLQYGKKSKTKKVRKNRIKLYKGHGGPKRTTTR